MYFLSKGHAGLMTFFLSPKRRESRTAGVKAAAAAALCILAGVFCGASAQARSVYSARPLPPSGGAVEALGLEQSGPAPSEATGKSSGVSALARTPAALAAPNALVMDRNSSPTHASTGCNEAHVSINPANPLQLTSSCNFYLSALTDPPGVNYALGLAYSNDGGATWVNDPAPGRVVPYFPGHNRAFDPTTAFARPTKEGVQSAYFCGASISTISNPTPPASRVVVTRLDGFEKEGIPAVGETMAALEPFPRDKFSFWDKPWMTVDTVEGSPFEGRIYVAAYPYFNDDAANNDPAIGGQWFTYSADRGQTWSAPVRLTYDDPRSEYGSYVQIAAGPLGEVNVCYLNYYVGSGAGMWFEKSLDGGVTWTTETLAYEVTNPNNDPYLELPGIDADYGWMKPVSVSGPFNANTAQRALNLPAMTCDTATSSPWRGNIYISWCGDPPPNDNQPDYSDVFLIRSTDGGETWSAPIRVNDDATLTDQYFPAIATTPDGRVIVMFYDSRYDSPANQLIDVTAAISYDGGQTFPDQRRLTDRSFPPGFSSGGLSRFIGDYNAIAASNERAVGVWCDFRTESIAGEVKRKQIISAAELLNTPEPTATPTPEPTASESPTPEPTASESPTPEPTASESPTPEPTASESPTPEPTETPTAVPTATPTEAPTLTPEPSPTESPEPTASETPAPTASATPEPTLTLTPEPTPSVSPAPSASPQPPSLWEAL